MSTTRRIAKSVRRYQSPDIPLSAIRRYARQIAAMFHPEQVILFGSYARGDQREGSDVDLLVVMPAANQSSLALRIRLALPSPFALDLIVRTPKRLQRGLAEGDWFLREILETGKVLYETSNRLVGPQGRSRLGRRSAARRTTAKTE